MQGEEIAAEEECQQYSDEDTSATIYEVNDRVQNRYTRQCGKITEINRRERQLTIVFDGETIPVRRSPDNFDVVAAKVEVGTTVIIHDYSVKALNGQKAEVDLWVPTANAWKVLLPSGDFQTIPEPNLQVICPKTILPGATVLVHGMKQGEHSKLNGISGQAIDFDQKKGAWKIELKSGKTTKKELIKEKYLQAMDMKATPQKCSCGKPFAFPSEKWCSKCGNKRAVELPDHIDEYVEEGAVHMMCPGMQAQLGPKRAQDKCTGCGLIFMGQEKWCRKCGKARPMRGEMGRFDGFWKAKSTLEPMAYIQGNELSWVGGSSCQIKPLGPTTFTVDMEGKPVKCTLTGEDQLTWEDGEAWIRETVKARDELKQKTIDLLFYAVQNGSFEEEFRAMEVDGFEEALVQSRTYTLKNEPSKKRKLRLQGLLRHLEDGNANDWDQPIGCFATDEALEEFEAWKQHKGKHSEQCREEFKAEWDAQKRDYGVLRSVEIHVAKPQDCGPFMPGCSVINRYTYRRGKVAKIGFNQLWIVFEGTTKPVPRAPENYMVVPNEVWTEEGIEYLKKEDLWEMRASPEAKQHITPDDKAWLQNTGMWEKAKTEKYVEETEFLFETPDDIEAWEADGDDDGGLKVVRDPDHVLMMARVVNMEYKKLHELPEIETEFVTIMEDVLDKYTEGFDREIIKVDLTDTVNVWVNMRLTPPVASNKKNRMACRVVVKQLTDNKENIRMQIEERMRDIPGVEATKQEPEPEIEFIIDEDPKLVKSKKKYMVCGSDLQDFVDMDNIVGNSSDEEGSEEDRGFLAKIYDVKPDHSDLVPMDVQNVSVSAKVIGLDIEALEANPAQRHGVEKAIKKTVMEQLMNVPNGNVRVSRNENSDFVNVEIEPPENIPFTDIVGMLTGKTETMNEDAAEHLKAVKGIEGCVTGLVDDIKVDFDDAEPVKAFHSMDHVYLFKQDAGRKEDWDKKMKKLNPFDECIEMPEEDVDDSPIHPMKGTITVQGVPYEKLIKYEDLQKAFELCVRQGICAVIEGIQPEHITCSTGDGVDVDVLVTPPEDVDPRAAFSLMLNSQPQICKKIQEAMPSVRPLPEIDPEDMEDEEKVAAAQAAVRTRLGVEDIQEGEIIVTMKMLDGQEPDVVLTTVVEGIDIVKLNEDLEMKPLVRAAISDAIAKTCEGLADEDMEVTFTEGLTVFYQITPPNPKKKTAQEIKTELRRNWKGLQKKIEENIRGIPGVSSVCSGALKVSLEEQNILLAKPKDKTPKPEKGIKVCGWEVPITKRHIEDAKQWCKDFWEDDNETAEDKAKYVEFEIEVDFEKSVTPLGFAFSDATCVNGGLLRVDTFKKDGLLVQWNAANPTKEVMVGDFIRMINGKRGTPEELKEILQINGHQVWTIRRNCVESHGALKELLEIERPTELKQRLYYSGLTKEEVEMCDENHNVKEALVATLLEKTAADDDYEFTVEIVRQEELTTLGMTVRPDGIENNSIIVVAISPEGALFKQWNEENQDKPVVIGDRILSIKQINPAKEEEEPSEFKDDPRALNQGVREYPEVDVGIVYVMTVRKSKIHARVPDPVARELKEEKKVWEVKELLWRTDNSILKADTPGLGMRKSTTQRDKATAAEDIVPWGTTVKAIEYDENWAKVGQKFLPRFLGTTEVLYKEEWQYLPFNDRPIKVREGPSFRAARSEHVVHAKEKFYVLDERQGNKAMFLKLADGRGWVFTRIPEENGLLCVRTIPEKEEERIKVGVEVDIIYTFESGFKPGDLPERIPRGWSGEVTGFAKNGDAKVTFPQLMTEEEDETLRKEIRPEKTLRVRKEDWPKMKVKIQGEEVYFDPEAAEREAALREELSKMKVSQLKNKARIVGIDKSKFDEVDDSDNPKEKLIDMIVEQMSTVHLTARVEVVFEFSPSDNLTLEPGHPGRVTGMKRGNAHIKFKGVRRREWVMPQDFGKLKLVYPPKKEGFWKELCKPKPKPVIDSEIEDDGDDDFEAEVKLKPGLNVMVHNHPDEGLNDREGRVKYWVEPIKDEDGAILKQGAWTVELLPVVLGGATELKVFKPENLKLKKPEIAACPNGHILKEFNLEGKPNECSCCEGSFPKPMFGCRPCDYDMCHDCYRLDVAVCPQGHLMMPLGTRENDGWMCRGAEEEALQPVGCRTGMTGFNQSFGVAKFICRQCDYELCEKCCIAMAKEQNRDLPVNQREVTAVEDQIEEKDHTIKQLQIDIQAFKDEDERAGVALVYAEIKKQPGFWKMERPVPPERKMILQGLQMQMEKGDVNPKEAPGFFSSKEYRQTYECHEKNKGKNVDVCKKEWVDEWASQRAEFCSQRAINKFLPGDQVYNAVMGETGIVTSVDSNILWITIGGRKSPVPRIPRNFEIVKVVKPLQMDQKVRVRNVRGRNKPEDWLPATITSLEPLTAKPENFEHGWTWDQVEPVAKEILEEVKVFDEVVILKGEHANKAGIIQKWNFVFNEFEVKLNSGEVVFIARESMKKKKGIEKGSHIQITGGVHKGAKATAVRLSEAWGEWEVKLNTSGEYVFVQRNHVVPCAPPPAAGSGWTSWFGR